VSGKGKKRSLWGEGKKGGEGKGEEDRLNGIVCALKLSSGTE